MKWSLAIVTVFLIWTEASVASENLVLKKGQAINQSLSSKSKVEYKVSLRAFEFFSFHVTPNKMALELTVYDPKGEPIQSLFPFDRPSDVSIAADMPGVYRVEVKGTDKVQGLADGSFKIDDIKHLSLEERLHPTHDPKKRDIDQSRFVKDLVTRVKKGSSEVHRFWSELKKRGSPIIEPIDKDDQQMLVTFFWQGSRDTHNVVVFMWPFSMEHQDQYKMSRLDGTDIWFKSLPIPKDARYTYDIGVNLPPPEVDGARAIINSARRFDPLNPKFRWDPHLSSASRFAKESILEMPDAPVQEWVKERPESAKGRIENVVFKSDLLKNARQLTIYLPPGFSNSGDRYPIFFLFDRAEYLTYVPTPTILDNLIAQKKIPPMIAVLIDFPHPQDDNRTRELTCNPKFSDFLNSELLPWIAKKYNGSTDAAKNVIGGSSFGGLAATCAGLYHPETFQNILSQSGSFWWTADFTARNFEENPKPEVLDHEMGDVMKMFIQKPKLPLRFYMEAGSKEIDLDGKEFDLLISGRHLRDVLLAKGYPVQWHQFRGGHDYLSWRGSLADGLIALTSSK